MILVADIGNTNVSLGICRGEKLVAVVKGRRPAGTGLGEWRTALRVVCDGAGIEPGEIDGASVSSVVPAATRSFARLCREATGRAPLVVRGGLPLGVKIFYADPNRLGPDRLCGMLAARRRYGTPVIVVDCGTAVTFDGLGRGGKHAGGMIAPGLAVSALSLAGSTAALPRLRWNAPKSPAGHSTRDAIKAGVFHSVVGSVKENVRQLKKIVGGDPVVVGTGGDAETLSRAGRLFDAIHPDLVLEGALRAYRLSRPGRSGRRAATVSRRGASR